MVRSMGLERLFGVTMSLLVDNLKEDEALPARVCSVPFLYFVFSLVYCRLALMFAS